MSVVFPRTRAPREAERPYGRSPIVVRAQNSRKQFRGSNNVGWRWMESWAAEDVYDDVFNELYAQIKEWHRSPTVVQVRPWHHSVARGDVSVGTTGAVNGADQSGTTLVCDGFPANGTFKRGDYLTVAGPNYALELTADTQADGAGNVTFQLAPPIYVGPQQPADDAVVTLNGLLDCMIVSYGRPRSVEQISYYRGLSVIFEEAVASVLEQTG